MLSKSDLVSIGQVNSSKKSHNQQFKLPVSYSQKYLDTIRRNVTGANIVNQAVPAYKATYDLTGVQKIRLSSNKISSWSECVEGFKLNNDVEQKLIQSGHKYAPKSKGKYTFAAHVLMNIPYYYNNHRNIIEYGYHYPHIVHLKLTNAKLLSNNKYLQKSLRSLYPGKDVENYVQRRDAVKLAINHKNSEIDLWQKPKYKKANYPINLHDDPYLRLVLYTSQHHKFSKGANKLTPQFLDKMQQASSQVITTQMKANYIPLKQREFNKINHKPFIFGKNAHEEEDYSIIHNGSIQKDDIKLIDKNIANHINPTSKNPYHLNFKHGTWSDCRKNVAPKKPIHSKKASQSTGEKLTQQYQKQQGNQTVER